MIGKWVDEITKSKDRYILVDAPRQSGKTTAAIDWAVKQTDNYSFTNFRHRNVLYACHNHEVARSVFFRIMEKYNEHVNSSYGREMKITFDWGGTIWIMSPPFPHQTKGRRMDAIVFDEPNLISEESYMECMLTTADNPERRVLAVSSGFTKGASNLIKGLSDYANVKYVFGEHDQTRKTNKDFTVLLRK